MKSKSLKFKHMNSFALEIHKEKLMGELVALEKELISRRPTYGSINVPVQVTEIKQPLTGELDEENTNN